MDDGGRAGRGRGRGMAPGEEHRGDLRRPHTTPQELTSAFQHPPTIDASKVFIENRGQPHFVSDTKSSQMVQGGHAHHQASDSNPNVQAQFVMGGNHQAQSHQINVPALQQHILKQQIANHHLANQQLANQHLVNQLQLASQQQQQFANQQMSNQQLGNLAPYANQQQILQQPRPVQSPQVFTSGNIPLLSQYMDPQKQQEYEELKKREFYMEQMKMLNQQQNSIQEQQRMQFQRQQQQKLQNQQASGLEIEQKLAFLQLTNPEALYLQQSPQQHHQFVQQQHAELQNKHQQMQFHQQQLQQQHVQISALCTQNEPIGRSTLSADAAEFVPRYSTRDSQHLEPSNGASELPNNLMPQQSGGHMSLIQIQPELASHPVVVQVDSAVVQLSSNPSKYDAIAPQLTRVLSWHIEDESLMREVITVIFEQGVGESNFRFTGGKLCEHLVKNVAQQYNGLSFKSILLHRCQEEFTFRHEYLAVQFYDRLIGFTFFLAEILTRLLTPAGVPITKLTEALCEMLNLLLEVSTNESLKCVAQVLKMSGRYLQMGDTDDIEGVMAKLRDIAMTPIPPNIKNLLMSVVEFRAANWGCNAEDSGDTKQNGETDETAAPSSAGSTSNGLPLLGTVFYGPDGAIQRIEEDCPEDYPSDSDDSATRQSWQQPKHAPQVHELDDDEGAAFEQFLLSMN